MGLFNLQYLQVNKLERELVAARSGRKETTGYSKPQTSGAQGQRAGAKSFNQMTLDEKRNITCREYNSNRGCSKVEMNGFCGAGPNKMKHGCSRIEGDFICWKRHSEVNHV